MAGHVEDRWTRPSGAVDARGRPLRVRTERWGQGKRWVASWHDAGKRRARSFETKDAATAHIAQVTSDQRAGTYISPHDMTVADYGPHWVAAQIHLRPKTAEQVEMAWRVHILPALGARRLVDISRRDIQAAVIAWTEALAPRTVRGNYGHLKRMLKAAQADRLIRDNPCSGINLPRVEQGRIVPLTVAQVQSIADSIGARYRGLVILGAASGLRSGELRGLTLDRLRWVDGPAPALPQLVLRVDRQLATVSPTWGPPKTPRSDRTVTVDALTGAVVRDHLAAHSAGSTGLLFTARNGRALSAPTANRAWHQAAGDGRGGLHQLRHFHASMLIAAGLSVVAVADRLGHKDSTETLRTYGHLWPSDEQRAVAAVSDALWGME